MPLAIEVQDRLKEVFTEKQAIVLTSVIMSSYDELVKTRDFNELKEIVREIAKEQRELVQAQKRTEEAQKRTEEAQRRTEEAQRRTEIKLAELAEAQRRTEIKVAELAEAQKKTEEAQKRTEEALRRTEIEIQKLTKGLRETNEHLGGLANTVSYAFENEAYRMLPLVLKEKYGIELKEKLIRVEMGDKEINILAKARRNGNDILVIGEAKLKIDEKRRKAHIFKELEEKVKAVKKEYKEEVVRVVVTHFATRGFIKQASEQGIIVVQSFEW